MFATDALVKTAATSSDRQRGGDEKKKKNTAAIINHSFLGAKHFVKTLEAGEKGAWPMAINNPLRWWGRRCVGIDNYVTKAREGES